MNLLVELPLLFLLLGGLSIPGNPGGRGSSGTGERAKGAAARGAGRAQESPSQHPTHC